MRLKTQLRIIGLMWAVLASTIVIAEEKTEQEDVKQEEKEYGVNIDLGFSTIYNFRGINSFAENTQQDSNAAYFPSITWSIGDTGLYLGYWGAYQLSGDNKKEMVDGALGHEQDLYIGYGKSFADDMINLNFGLTYFFYPFSDIPDSSNPSIIEPLIGFDVSSVLDMGLSISYFAGIGDATKEVSHLYLNPWIGKSLSLGDYVGMDLAFGLGYKVWQDKGVREVNDNAVDLVFDVSLPITVPGTNGLYVIPTISSAWTNLKNMYDDEGNSRKATVGDEFMIYASINVGADF